MSSLSSSPALSFRVPSMRAFERETQTVKLIDDTHCEELPKIYQGSILIKELGVLGDENKSIVDQIKSFEFLEDNWDVEGARKIPYNVIQRAIDLINIIDENNINVYLASPGPNQEILLMLKNNNREVEFILYPSKEKYVKFEGANFIEQGSLESKEFNSFLDWIS